MLAATPTCTVDDYSGSLSDSIELVLTCEHVMETVNNVNVLVETQSTEVKNEDFTLQFVPPSLPPIHIPSTQVTATFYNRDSTVSTSNVTTDTSYTSSGADPMVQCCIEVFVTSTCDGSTFSSPTTKICTLTSDNTPGAIQNLTLFHASPTSIVITWDNPANYQRRGLTFEITVNETASGSVVYQTSVQDVGNLDITGLAPISAYTLAITATNSAGDKEPSPTTLEFTTQLSPPPPPTSVSIAFVSVGDNITLRISWVDDTALEYNLTSHTVYSRCNGNTTTISVTSVAGQNSVNVSVPVTSDMWCAAQVQGQNDIGLGTLSELAEVYRPKIVPPTPRCFEDENLGSLLRVTFDVTDALSLEKYVTYGLTGPGRSAGEEKVYGPFRGYNNVTFRGLMRGAEYAFSLRMCNDVGCSENCEKDIATAIVSLAYYCTYLHTLYMHVHVMQLAEVHVCTVDLEIFVYENFQGTFFRVKIFRGSVVPTKIILHEIFCTRKHARRTYCVGDYHASFVTFKKQLLVLVCENEPWCVVKSGCKRNGGPTER